MKSHHDRRVGAACLAALLVSGAATACSDDGDGPGAALDAFADGWPSGNFDQVEFVTPEGDVRDGEAAAEEFDSLLGALTDHREAYPPEATAGEVTTGDGDAEGELAVTWPLPGGGTWEYQAPVRLSEGDDGWRVVWEPTAVHPELRAGDRIALQRLAPERADILDTHGDPLVTARPVTTVGVWPSRVDDIDVVVDRLDSAFASLGYDFDLGDLPDRYEEALDDDLYVEVVTLRREEYEEIAPALVQVPGIEPRESERHLAPERTFARALLGTVDAVTAEVMEESPGVYAPGDLVGYGGLSGHYDTQLRGTVGQVLTVERETGGADAGTDGSGTDSDAGEGDEDTETETVEIGRVEPEPGTALATTLAPEVQRAAESALAEESQPASLVALRIDDGQVVAVANTEGDQAHPVNTAVSGAVAPGSTFKAVTAYQLLATGALTLDTPVPCPEERTVEGYPISNAFDGDRGEIPFREAIEISCNTAFAEIAPELGDDGLATGAAALGIGGDWDIGMPTVTGEVPTGGSAVDRAVAAFGQGETVVSPVAMAAAFAAVARGAWLPPTVVRDTGQERPDPEPLPQDVVDDLHEALRTVVTDGTATGVADVPGGPVHGKTGTAEAGEDTTHGWFVGWQDDLAVAVFVEDGRSGSGAAVPLADGFLRSLAG